jgi:hypothetical protein
MIGLVNLWQLEILDRFGCAEMQRWFGGEFMNYLKCVMKTVGWQICCGLC